MVQSINSTQKIEETDGLPMPKRIWAVVSVGFALCMSVLDINIVNIVLPTLSHDFGTSPAVTTWIINGYQLAIVISLLSFSALGEIIGYRKVFLSGIGLFCITSLICALSDSFWTLTVARIFQGFSASAITSVNTAQLRYIYPKSQIGRGMGINAMVVAISAAAGPSVASGRNPQQIKRKQRSGLRQLPAHVVGTDHCQHNQLNEKEVHFLMVGKSVQRVNEQTESDRIRDGTDVIEFTFRTLLLSWQMFDAEKQCSES